MNCLDIEYSFKQRQILKSFKKKPKLYKTVLNFFNMPLEISVDSFWDGFRKLRDQACPNPKYESIYFLRKNYGFTAYVLNSLAKDNLVRSQGIPAKYAKEDVIKMYELRHVVNVAEEADILKSNVINGKSSYLVLDNHAKGMSLDQYQINAFKTAFEGHVGQIYNLQYDFVPKTLTLDEKIQWLRDEEAKKASETKGK